MFKPAWLLAPIWLMGFVALVALRALLEVLIWLVGPPASLSSTAALGAERGSHG